VATTAFVRGEISSLVASSPAALDTLNELAAALGNDANFSTTVTNALALKANLASPTLTGTPSAPTAAVGTNTTQVATTAYVNAEIVNDAVTKAAFTAKGDLIVATASGTPTNLAVGANNTVPVADSAQSTGIRWASSLSGLTLTNPTIAAIVNTGTLTLPTSTDTLVGRATTDTLTNKTLTSPAINYPVIVAPIEGVTVSATAATGTIAFDTRTQAVLFYTSNASANWTLNVRGSSGVTLNSALAVGQAITVVFMVTQGASAFFQSALQIDGAAVTPRWQGGTAPTAGNASSVDVYTITIVKTAATPTYSAFAALTQFK
jgi:hypothetical protein